MYGTLGRMTPKAGKRDELIALMSAPQAGGAANGYRGGYLLKADEGDDVVVAVMYDDKDAYVAMVHDPPDRRELREIMALLQDKPTWTDGEWIHSLLVATTFIRPDGREKVTGAGRYTADLAPPAWPTPGSATPTTRTPGSFASTRRGRRRCPGSSRWSPRKTFPMSGSAGSCRTERCSRRTSCGSRARSSRASPRSPRRSPPRPRG